MQGFHLIQSTHENRHTVEKVVYSLLYDRADVTLSNYACCRFDDWLERRSNIFYSTNSVTWNRK